MIWLDNSHNLPPVLSAKNCYPYFTDEEIESERERDGGKEREKEGRMEGGREEEQGHGGTGMLVCGSAPTEEFLDGPWEWVGLTHHSRSGSQSRAQHVVGRKRAEGVVNSLLILIPKLCDPRGITAPLPHPSPALCKWGC